MDRFIKSPALPVLSGILSVMFLFRSSAHRIGWSQLGVPLLVCSLWAVLIWAVLYFTPYIRRLTRKESGLVGSALVLVTLSWMAFPSSLVATCVAWALLVVIVLSKSQVQRYLNYIGVVWIACTLFVVTMWAGFGSVMGSSVLPVVSTATPVVTGRLPSIFVIIPDRFTSVDGMGEFGVDADGFVASLRGRGFHVREDAMSVDTFTPTSEPVSTTRTLRFMASFLNGGEPVPVDVAYNKASRMVQDAQTVRMLKSMGYEFYNVGSWFTETRAFVLADGNYTYKGYDLMSFMYGSELSTAVMDRSFFRELDASVLMRYTGYDVRREEHWFQWETVVELASESGSKLIFCHLMLPHPPYVWDADGTPAGRQVTPVKSYVQQVEFTKGYLLSLVDAVVGIDPDAVVLVQSDEGVMFDNPDFDTGLVESQWNGVLTAWRVPDVEDGELDGVLPAQVLGYVAEELLKK